MKTMGNIMLCLSFLTVCLCGTGCFFSRCGSGHAAAVCTVCLCGTGCFFSRATLNNLGETRWRYSTYSTALSPDESEVITKYRKKTEHDCWPFLTAWHVTWNTNSFVEERAPFEKPDGEDVDLNLYRPQSVLNTWVQEKTPDPSDTAGKRCGFSPRS